MFHIHGVQGRVFSGTLEQLPQQLVTGVARIRRAELMPAASLEPPSVASASARLSQPVTAAMWSPVPSTAPGTDLLRALTTDSPLDLWG